MKADLLQPINAAILFFLVLFVVMAEHICNIKTANYVAQACAHFTTTNQADPEQPPPPRAETSVFNYQILASGASASTVAAPFISWR